MPEIAGRSMGRNRRTSPRSREEIVPLEYDRDLLELLISETMDTLAGILERMAEGQAQRLHRILDDAPGVYPVLGVQRREEVGQ